MLFRFPRPSWAGGAWGEAGLPPSVLHEAPGSPSCCGNELGVLRVGVGVAFFYTVLPSRCPAAALDSGTQEEQGPQLPPARWA